MPFQKGKSGNPGGKSKEQCEFERKCRQYLDEKGWKALEEMAGAPRTRQWALSVMLDRGFGRPKETLDVTTRDESAFSPDELANSITELIAGEAAKGDGSGKPSEGTA